MSLCIKNNAWVTEKPVAVFLKITTATEAVLTAVVNVSQGTKQDVVVEGSIEPGIESIRYRMFSTKEIDHFP